MSSEPIVPEETPKPLFDYTQIATMIEEKFIYYNSQIGEIIDKKIYEKEFEDLVRKKKKREETLNKVIVLVKYAKYLVSAIPASLITYYFNQ